MRTFFLCFLFITALSPLLFSQDFDAESPTEISSSIEEALLLSKRREMVQRLTREFGVTDQNVLNAMEQVPRHLFLPASLQRMAYEFSYIPLGNGQVLPEPELLTRLLINLDLNTESRVLVAGNSGAYTAALIAFIAQEVYLIEGVQTQYELSTRLFATLGITNVSTIRGNDFMLWKTSGPFDAIVVHGAVETVSSDLLSQVKPNGRLICSIADPSGFQILILVTKTSGRYSISSIGESFFPFLDFN